MGMFRRRIIQPEISNLMKVIIVSSENIQKKREGQTDLLRIINSLQ